MKTSDYIVEYLINKNITDVFGYPGGMVTHLMESFSKYQNKINVYLTYNEQGAAMAACGYAQASGKLGVAYATSGPGATNMVTGICNAYMDSIPTLFITGQVNSFEQKGNLKIRQRGFQETDIVSMVKNVTKYAVKVNDANEIKYHLDRAFYEAENGRKGPVLLDIAMDVTKKDIDLISLNGYNFLRYNNVNLEKTLIDTLVLLNNAKRPVILLGNGLSRNTSIDKKWKKLVNSLEVPIVSSMIAIDVQEGLSNYFGFIGAYGDRVANFIVAKSDFILTLGARLDVRQVGAKREKFAPNAQLVRVDIDSGELEYKVHSNEIDIIADANIFLDEILKKWPSKNYSNWIKICRKIKKKLKGIDDRNYNFLVSKISHHISENAIITTDVGQNQVWVAQSFKMKFGQRILFSGGHGAMGYSLPASIGAYVASGNEVYSFNGDGGIQMNIQELQLISREKFPIKIVIFNNNALGMIRHFQEMYFNNNYFQTTPKGGFTSPDFKKIADAYGFNYGLIKNLDDVDNVMQSIDDDQPAIIEVQLFENTHVFPKLEYGKPNQDPEPLLERELYNYLNKL